jgi:hypothetical protein
MDLTGEPLPSRVKPHPARSEWVNNDSPTHRDTDPANAAVCADCHLGGQNSTLPPPPTPAPGTQPGCFNGTLCHPGGSDFHPSGWMDKANRGTDTWHATAYQTDLLVNDLGCLDCHTPPPLDSPPDGQCTLCHFGSSGNREVSGWSHGQTDHKQFQGTTEEPVCVACHEINNQLGYSPECHNCHETASPSHPPGAMQGFGSCQSCHGDGFDGGTASVSCQTCHGSNAPHPDGTTWSSNAVPTHTDTDPGNAVICSDCHLNGQNSTLPPPQTPAPGTQPGCFNGTLCHSTSIHIVPYLDHDQVVPNQSDFNSNCDQCHNTTGTQPDQSARRCDDCHRVGSPYVFTNCTSCHGDPPSTGKHKKHDDAGFTDCDTCHTGGGTGTGLNHGYDDFVDLLEPIGEPIIFNRTTNNISCTYNCHGENHQNIW